MQQPRSGSSDGFCRTDFQSVRIPATYLVSDRLEIRPTRTYFHVTSMLKKCAKSFFGGLFLLLGSASSLRI